MARRKKYGGSGTGLSRILSFISNTGSGGDIEGSALNQAIPAAAQKEGYSGPQQYYSNAPKSYGQVTNNPSYDNRGWFQRGMGAPSVASEINSRTLLGELEGERSNRYAEQAMRNKAAFEDTRFPIELEQAGKTQRQTLDIAGEADINKQRDLTELKTALASVDAPVLSEIATMGSLPFNLPLSPEQGEGMIASARQQKLPFVPVNEQGIKLNADMAEQQSQQQARDFLRNKPEFSNLNNTLFRLPTSATGKVEPEFSVEPPYESGIKIDANGNVSMGGHVPSAVINRKPKDRAFVPGQQPNILPSEWHPPMLPPANESVAGRPPIKASQFTPPDTTEPSALYDYGKPGQFPSRRLRPGGNPARLQEQIAAETNVEPTEEEKMRMSNPIMQWLKRYYKGVTSGY